MTTMKNINFWLPVIAVMVFIAAFSRLLPHPSNFTPIGAMSLFGAAYFAKRVLALVIPIMSLWLSDLVLNNVIYAKYLSGVGKSIISDQSQWSESAKRKSPIFNKQYRIRNKK